jgi:hypothetical protein
MSMSADGNMLAFGARDLQQRSENDSKSGHVRVYEWKNLDFLLFVNADVIRVNGVHASAKHECRGRSCSSFSRQVQSLFFMTEII